MGLNLTKFTENVNNISSLPDTPTETSTQLKEKFDKAGIDIKSFINESLIKEITTQVEQELSKIETSTNKSINELNTKTEEIEINIETNYSLKTELEKNRIFKTTEQDTGKIWIDGKKIYRRIYKGTITNNPVDLKNLNIENGFFDLTHSRVEWPSVGRIYPVFITSVASTGSLNSQAGVYFNSDFSSFTIENGSANPLTNWVITIEYTKKEEAKTI